MKEISDKTFKAEIIQSKLPVLIEFWASWCLPCKAIDIILKDLENLYDSKVKIAKLNVDRNRTIPNKLDITGIPTFMIFENGKITDTKVGAQSKNSLIEMIEKVLK
ncbi:MAG: thioredoxin [Candidatus Hermodarchaeota archaeon]